jgi:hypothetical protein
MHETQGQLDRHTEIRHLLRTVKTSLELAIVARAPMELVNRLGRVSGLLDAVSQLSFDEGGAQVLTASLIGDATAAVDAWQKWERERAPVA